MGRLVSTASRTLRYRSSTHPAVPVSEPSISSPAYSPGRRLDDPIFYNTVVLGLGPARVRTCPSGIMGVRHWLTFDRPYSGRATDALLPRQVLTIVALCYCLF